MSAEPSLRLPQASSQFRAAPGVLAGGLLALAPCMRVLVDVDPVRSATWIALAGASFLGATIFWAALVFGDAKVRQGGGT
jgi:hypothetical protein